PRRVGRAAARNLSAARRARARGRPPRKPGAEERRAARHPDDGDRDRIHVGPVQGRDRSGPDLARRLRRAAQRHMGRPADEPLADVVAPSGAGRDHRRRRTARLRARHADFVKVTAEAARRFFVARQFLAPARSLKGKSKGVLEVFRRFGSVQFDPLSVAGRNHDLVLHARVAGYEPAWSDRLYQRREIFEAYNKGLSLVPTDEYPWFRGTLSRRSPALIAENIAVAERVLERIRAEGPLSALDFEREQGPTKDWFGMPTNVVRAVLEAYAVTGVLGLSRREGNRRYYDLLERLVPADVLAEKIPLEEQLRHKLLSRYRAHGLLG